MSGARDRKNSERVFENWMTSYHTSCYFEMTVGV